VVTEDYFLVRRMDYGGNDRLDNKRSFAAFALRLTLEALDRVVEGEERESETFDGQAESSEIDTSELDPSDEEWEGSMSWQATKKTVVEEISEVDLASLTDWDD
jgi:hypothetical protein